MHLLTSFKEKLPFFACFLRDLALGKCPAQQKKEENEEKYSGHGAENKRIVALRQDRLGKNRASFFFPKVTIR